MNIIGNLALIFTTLCYFGLASMAGKPIPGGDRGMGHALALLFLFAGLTLGLIVTTVIIFLKGGFEWVPTTNSLRNSLVVFGILSLLVMAFYTAMGPGGAPWIVKLLGKYTIIWLMPPVLLGGFILLNPSLQAFVPNAVWKWPFNAIVFVSISCCVLMVGEWLVRIPINIVHRGTARKAYDDTRRQEFLAQIERNNPMTEMVLILVFTTKYQDAAVREAALAKIKSNPQWQEYLADRLQTPWADEVFRFLADNDVEDKALFAQPIKAGILMMAEKFKESMERTHTFYDGQFYSETEAVLQTLEKLRDSGVDYAPAVRKLRKALDTRLKSYQHAANFRCIPMLDAWLKNHS
jgi:predicted DCC family thiol-disulfide oxidoreductase YuxK